MSTLGRKAMKKTLERLKLDALKATDNYLSLTGKLIAQEKDEEMLDFLGMIIERSHPMIVSLSRYIQALEDYGYELDEEWDKLLKSIEEAQQPKPTQKKEEAKKTSYIK